jgi:hypothetical protein
MLGSLRQLLIEASAVAGADIGQPYWDIWHNQRVVQVSVGGRRFRYTPEKFTQWREFAFAPRLDYRSANPEWPRIARRLLDNVQV